MNNSTVKSDNTCLPALEQLEASARSLFERKVMSRGGKRPSEKALALWCRSMALKSLAELKAGTAAWPPRT